MEKGNIEFNIHAADDVRRAMTVLAYIGASFDETFPARDLIALLPSEMSVAGQQGDMMAGD